MSRLPAGFPARLLALGLAVLLALGLFASHVAAWRRMLATTEVVTVSQGQALMRALQGASRRGPPEEADLAAFLDAERGSGLTYVAVLRGDAVVGQAGEPERPVTAADLQRLRAGEVLTVGHRRWLLAGPPPGGGHGPPPFEGGPPDGGRPDGGPPDGGPPDGGPPDGGPGDPRLDVGGHREPPAVLFEYEPLLSDELQSATQRDLVLSALATLALVAATVWLWRSEQAAESARAAVERQRHLATLGEMSAVLAHEIRNPLAALKGHAQLLEEAGGPTAAKARRVVDEAKRLERIATDLLDFARTSRADRAPIDLLALAREVAEERAPGRATVTGEATVWPVDAGKVRMALGNLLENAVLAAPEGAIEVRVARDGRDARIVVRDHGPGFAPGDLERAGTPFFTTRTRGVGLGLAVARRMAELHGGRLVVANAADGGAELTLVLGEG